MCVSLCSCIISFRFSQAVFTPQTPYDKEAVMDAAINLDIEEIDFIENTDHLHHNHDEAQPAPDLIVTNADQMNLLHELTEKLSIGGTSHLVYLPKERVETSEEDYEKNVALVEGFENLDDVDTVFHNME